MNECGLLQKANRFALNATAIKTAALKSKLGIALKYLRDHVHVKM